MTTTNKTKTAVFFKPMTLRITSMLGRLSAGPAKSKADVSGVLISNGVNPQSAPSSGQKSGQRNFDFAGCEGAIAVAVEADRDRYRFEGVT